MKLLRFDSGDGPRLGALAEGRIVDLKYAARKLNLGVPEGWLDPDINNLISAGPDALKAVGAVIFRVHEAADASLVSGDVRLLAPVQSPSKIIAVGQNYMDHVREQSIKPPERPILFSKAPTSIIGPGDAISWPAGFTSQVDPEVEVGVIIGSRTKGVSVSAALDSVFGYTVLNDVSARDVQFGDVQWVRGKSPDTFCPLGPVIVTRDEIPDPQNLRLSCAVNGRAWQDSNTKEMIFSIAALISFIAQGITLLPGDIVATGTPHGVGVFQHPPVFLKAGDRLRLEIEKIGVLENPVGGPF